MSIFCWQRSKQVRTSTVPASCKLCNGQKGVLAVTVTMYFGGKKSGEAVRRCKNCN